jgi:hypothetical protein
MDRYQRQVMAMHIRRLGDGDKAQYIQHFAEAREVTVGEYQEYMDDIDRKFDILRNMSGNTVDAVANSMMMSGILSDPGVGYEDAVSGNTCTGGIISMMGLPSHLLGMNNK